MQEQSISVELTLTSKKSTPKWLASSDGPSELMIAEGFGVIYDGGNTRSFLWTVHFSPWTLKAQDVDTSNQSNIPSVVLGFLGEHDFNSKISDDIKDKLLECLYLSFEVPILQDPKSIMEMGIFFEYDSSTIPTDNKLEQLNQSVEEAEGLIYYWAEWIMKKTHVDDQCACLCFLLNLLDNYWRIGQKYTFKIMR
jgi:hypothetical protein